MQIFIFFRSQLQATPFNEHFSVPAPKDEISNGSQLLNSAEQVEIPTHIQRELEHSVSPPNYGDEISDS
jgi:hypothetical protein